MFAEIKKESFDEREVRILKLWEEKKTFQRSVENRRDRPLFSFYDGPPFATGLPHYGHYLAGTIKDVILRYKTMRNFCVPRRFGWDCHGLPIENEIEKAFNLTGAASIEEFGVANFNEECRNIVLRYTNEWRSLVTRMGRWVDFDNIYRTMDRNFMESVWWVLGQLYSKGLVYEGYKVMPYSAKLGTPLSNFEAGENYKDVDDPSLTVSFELLDEPGTSVLAWTTTPWTLISNLALMIGPEIEYVKIRDLASGRFYILAKTRLGSYYKTPEEYEIAESLSAKSLEGRRYRPLFPHFADRAAKGAFRIILEEAVSTEDGTGVVHSAPAFGELDFYACRRENIELVCPVDGNGQFTAEVPEYLGLFVKDADKDIIRHLKKENHVFLHSTLHHRYPFCWRSDTPLIYKAVTTWFVAVEKIKEQLLESNKQIHWTPGHIKFGRFGKWLEGARDWAISRNRYWGTPIPIWRAEDGDILIISSIAELEEATGQKVDDLHRHFIDDLTINKNGKTYKRIPEVFDCWFESGSMPYAQNHYPFENKELFENTYPADFIGEGLDQTRGWFYTLTILSTALFNKPAFKNVIVNGLVLAADGAKMSKRLRNYPDPSIVVNKFGADAVRLYMMHSPAVRGDDLCFLESGVELIVRQILIPFWNAYSFFITYARIYDWQPPEKFSKPEAVIDRWALSLLNKLTKEVQEGMDDYDLSRSVEPFVGFVDQLTNWYIRRTRRRFWDEKPSKSRDDAFETLYQVLITLSKIAAPFIPFLSEAIYQNMCNQSMPDSVHLCTYPDYQEDSRNIHLEEVMAAVQEIVSLGHGLRKEHKLKVRQPLGKAFIASADPRMLAFLEEQQHLIADELNVKNIEFTQDEHQFVSLKAKPNFRVLGKKVGKLMKAAQVAIDALGQGELEQLLNGQSITLKLEGESIELTPEDLAVERTVHGDLIAANKGAVTIALDTTLDEELLLEGFARELVNKINTMRRDEGYAVSDRIKVALETTERVQESFVRHRSYICEEVLAVDVVFAPTDGTEWDLNGEPAKIAISKKD
ncbi:MAG: isoleucine--tRNA ligase [Parachlamydiaceae bacterium]|nr:isoleucine--tRNA ligase [Parachlamydiaceae bacterium]